MKKAILFLFICFLGSQNPSFAQNVGGIGAQLLMDTTGGHTMPMISGLVPGTAADQFLKATDYIVKVNGTSCLDKTLVEVVGMIRGEVGTKVHVTVADTKEGKNPREYDLVRGAISSITTKSIDPVAAFTEQCENDVREMKKKGITIIKTFPSDCGNYFFNFDAEAQTYTIRVMLLEGTGDAAKPFDVTARVFDNANEKESTEISRYRTENTGSYTRGLLDGTATFKKAGVGVVNVQLHDDGKKCKTMYVVICK
jgi:hypothetical protein